jgi:Subtilase family
MTRPLAACLAALAAGLLAAPAARAASAVNPFSVTLPGDASVASVRADRATWIVGAAPTRSAALAARRYGARHVGLRQLGAYAIASSRARAFAGALRSAGVLLYAQPNAVTRVSAVPDDPLSVTPNAWRAHVVSPSLDPPPVTPTSPLIALVDTMADTSHVEWTGDPNFTSLGGLPLNSLHGTATAAVAAAPANHIGILGVWPGARALNVPLPADSITCAESAQQIGTAITQILGPAHTGRGVINMSYGSPDLCLPEYVELQFATGAGIVPVAAGGNDGESGSPPEFPASLPHVLTVAAVDSKDKPPGFSNVSKAMDLAAPGVGIETAIPPSFDTADGTVDGYTALSGTSFSAPMVSAAVAWIEAAEPHLRGDQVAQVVRRGARDVGRKGWDQNTGFGVLDINRALVEKAPPHDPTEPNDNILWVEGPPHGPFAQPDPLLWKGGRRAHLSASVNPYEDFADVYRIRIPAHRSARVSVSVHSTGVSLRVFNGGAASINDNKHRVAYSHLSGHATEHGTVHNRGRKAHVYYVDVEPQGVSHSRDVRYTLRVS